MHEEQIFLLILKLQYIFTVLQNLEVLEIE